MKWKTLIPVILFFLSFCTGAYSESLFHSLYAPREYDLTEVLELKNSLPDSPVRVTILLPVIQEEKPFQQVRPEGMSPSPQRQFRDSLGNRLAEYVIDLPGGGKARIEARYRIKVYDFIVDADTSRIPGRCEVPSQVRTFLQPQQYIESAHPRIIEAASRVTAGESLPYYEALKLYDYMIDEFTFELTRKPNSALGALDAGIVQCCDATLLYIALCRARGIPARYVGGLYLVPEERWEDQDSTHAWAEIYIPPYGWIPVDPTQGHLSEDRRYRCFAQRRPLYFSIWKGMRDGYTVKGGDNKDGTPAVVHTLRFKTEEIHSKAEVPMPVLKNPLWLDSLTSKRSPPGVQKNISAGAQDHFRRGLEFSLHGVVESALAEYQQALELEPAFHLAHQKFIEGHLAAHTLDRALQFYELKVKKEENNPLYHYYVGICALHKCHYSKSLKEFDNAERLGFSEPPLLYNGRGYLYLVTKQFSRAAEEFRKAIGAQSDYFRPYGNLTDIFFYLEDWEDLKRWSERALLLFPEREGLWYNLGFAYFSMKDYDKAEKSFKKAIELAPAEGRYHAVLGWVYREKGELWDARREILKGLKLGVKNRDFYKVMLGNMSPQAWLSSMLRSEVGSSLHPGYPYLCFYSGFPWVDYITLMNIEVPAGR